jgi:sec-independent protein translocase protein TatA
MSGGEIFVIILAIIIVFGPKRLPEIARGFGKGMREFKKATDEIKKEIMDADISKDISKDIKDINNELKG